MSNNSRGVMKIPTADFGTRAGDHRQGDDADRRHRLRDYRVDERRRADGPAGCAALDRARADGVRSQPLGGRAPLSVTSADRPSPDGAVRGPGRVQRRLRPRDRARSLESQGARHRRAAACRAATSARSIAPPCRATRGPPSSAWRSRTRGRPRRFRSAGRMPSARGAVRFTPILPFEAGREYVVVFDPAAAPAGALSEHADGLTNRVRRPRPRARPPVQVTDIYPGGPAVPANLLRMYVEFSGPMGTLTGQDYMRIVDAGRRRHPGRAAAARHRSVERRSDAVHDPVRSRPRETRHPAESRDGPAAAARRRRSRSW